MKFKGILVNSIFEVLKKMTCHATSAPLEVT